ncbi:MAG: proline--tRNA ligase [Deltaproteobacteria bacterium]|nr:MAG: proline--tRNA ligase [Deltaproteobacteria bacterium]
MRASRAHIVTYRDDPADAEVISHKLMARAGYIYKVSAGLYAYSPLMWRVLKKVQNIIRDELDDTGALEVQLPILQSDDLWKRSGRWDAYQASGTMFSTTDRKEATYGLAPTAEEVVTDYAASSVNSYKQLPINLYQIHTKFRDEIRPRFGLLRVKEFLMKDAYSFDVDEAGLDASYEAMRVAYHRIFERMGLRALGVDADPGDIGGSGSMEFMLAAETGEDDILVEPGTGYAANVEKAESRLSPSPSVGEAPRALRIEDTPEIRTVAELEGFFPEIEAARMVKTVLVKAVHQDEEVLWAVLIRGDQEINEVKLKNHVGGLAVQMLTAEEIAKHTGAQQGFAGPIGLNEAFSIVGDLSVKGMVNLLCGCNQTDKHALDVVPGRDFAEPAYADLRLARPGDPGPREGRPLELYRGIEVGHIFKLGTKYSAPMGATFIGENGKPQPFVMGCYGIGVSRVAASAVEQYADDKGIVWPVPIAPFEAIVTCLNPKKEELASTSERVYEALKSRGIEVMLDDRKMGPGAKLKDAELLGFPYAVVVGRSWETEQQLEVRNRRTGESETLGLDEAIDRVVAAIEAERPGLESEVQ